MLTIGPLFGCAQSFCSVYKERVGVEAAEHTVTLPRLSFSIPPPFFFFLFSMALQLLGDRSCMTKRVSFSFITVPKITKLHFPVLFFFSLSQSVNDHVYWKLRKNWTDHSLLSRHNVGLHPSKACDKPLCSHMWQFIKQFYVLGSAWVFFVFVFLFFQIFRFSCEKRAKVKKMNLHHRSACTSVRNCCHLY